MINFNNPRQVAKAIQFTNVNPELTKDELIAHLDICKDYGFDAAMIAPCWVRFAKEYLKDTDIRVATTLNFPQANDTTAMKVALVHQLGTEGADEFDFPPNPGFLLSGMETEYYEEIKQVVDAAHSYGMKVKVMLEFGFLPTDELKAKATQLSMEAGVDWVKQSSGWGKGGCEATTHDVRISKKIFKHHVKSKSQAK